MYTDGSKQDPDPTLGAAVVHPASGLTILINATGQEELNTILRAELAAIHQALIEFRDIPTFKCLTDSLTSLQQLQTVLTRPQEVCYYPHHVLLHAIVEEIVARDTKGFVTHIRKVTAHVGVRGNELADAAAKSVIANKDRRCGIVGQQRGVSGRDLPSSQADQQEDQA